MTFFLDFPMDIDAALVYLAFRENAIDIEKTLVLAAVEVVVVNLEQQTKPATGLETEIEFVGTDKGQAERQPEKTAGFQDRHFFVGGVSHIFFRQLIFEDNAGDEVLGRGHANSHDSGAVFCLKGIFGALADKMIAYADGIGVGKLRIEGRLFSALVAPIDNVIVEKRSEMEQFYEYTIPFGAFDICIDFFRHQQRDYGTDTLGVFAQQDVIGNLNHLTEHGVKRSLVDEVEGILVNNLLEFLDLFRYCGAVVFFHISAAGNVIFMNMFFTSAPCPY